MACRNFHRIHEEKQGINSMLELITWMTSESLVDTLHIDYGRFSNPPYKPPIRIFNTYTNNKYKGHTVD